MSHQFIPYSLERFLQDFVPEPIDSDGNPRLPPDFSLAFAEMMTDCLEPLMYQSFIDCVANANICPGFAFAKTESLYALDDEGQKKVDVCLFKLADVANADEKQRPDCSNQALHVEFKTSKNNAATAGDPFQDGKEPFESDTQTRVDARGQIISYASELGLRQHRVFFFTFMILGTDARLIRWDRAGAAVTERFNYRKDPSLAVFLWRFSQLSMEQQGYDLTATRIDPTHPLIQSALEKHVPPYQAHAQEFFREAVSSAWPVYKVVVDHHPSPTQPEDGELEDDLEGGEDDLTPTKEENRASGDSELREYIIGKPKFKAGGMTGRATRGYVALDVKTEQFVWLKDVWRIGSLHKEGDIIQELNRKEVRNVPTLVCHGDVQQQKTKSQTFWQGTDGDNPMKEYIHYRLVVAEVGLDLSEFASGLELIRIIRHCLIAHQDAYEQLSILHRDISTGNLLIVPGPGRSPGFATVRKGMLNDWDLCKKVDKSGKETKPRQIYRTGTWAFMSANLLLDLSKQHVLQDDLESFFHVLLHHAVVYLDTNCNDVPGFVADFFDSYTTTADRCIGGKCKHSAFLQGEILDSGMQSILFSDESPMNTLIAKIIWPFHNYYLLKNTQKGTTDSSLPLAVGPKEDRWERYEAELESGGEDDDDDDDGDNHRKHNLDISTLEKEAKAICSHRDMVRFFTKFSKEELWPRDKLPAHRIKANLKPRTSNAVKRDSGTVELATGERPFKRSKLSEMTTSRLSTRLRTKPNRTNSHQHSTGQRRSGRP
ncbi:hypothetical protein JAAARDRAFT_56722 [Jaapia argillacea MUCL 33604]|uniref:Fungal-type protein kinase domain-containing protein n=1 Tax=Jaapia argillacea MUCL 33604 TaxID=933084 RepID=A0A067Q8C3_9AGAM|nr:hypothetical protein JAAARDRAFT_56722 [Jaapia argillacea MUCL 33604]